MNFELFDNLLQIIVLGCAAGVACVLGFKKQQRSFLLLAFAYACFAMGTAYWVLHIAITGDIKRVFYVPEISWGASYLFYLSLQILRSENLKLRFSLRAAIGAFVLAGVILSFHIFGPSYLVSSVFAGIVASITYLTILRRELQLPGRKTDFALLRIVVLQVALYVVSAFLTDYTHFNLYFAVDFMLTASFISLIPLIGQEVQR